VLNFNRSLHRRHPDSTQRRSTSAALVAFAALLLLSACSSTSDEDQVRAVIAAAEKAAEARDTSELMDLVADDYADSRGFDKAQLTQYLRGYFLIHPKIEIVTRIGEIEFETANRARLDVEVVMVGTQGNSAAASLTGDLESMKVELQRRGSEWMVTRVDRKAR
jgi:hypothetical protein